MDQADTSTSSTRGRRSKVARVLDEYDLKGVGDELERRWTADVDRSSLRDLASYFNRQLLEHALREADEEPLDGEVENVYRLLTDEEVTNADRTRLRRRLQRNGVDVDALEDDFVTYQAIRTYLQNYRNVEYEADDTEPLERETRHIQQLQGRLVSVAEGKLGQLRSTDELDLGEFSVFADVKVVCEDCNSQFGVGELLERGSCDCTD